MRISKWGNSRAVRLPKSIVEKLDLREGDEINLGVAEGPPATFEVSRQPTRAEQVEAAIEQLRSIRGILPANIEFDREEANAR